MGYEDEYLIHAMYDMLLQRMRRGVAGLWIDLWSHQRASRVDLLRVLSKFLTEMHGSHQISEDVIAVVGDYDRENEGLLLEAAAVAGAAITDIVQEIAERETQADQEIEQAERAGRTSVDELREEAAERRELLMELLDDRDGTLFSSWRRSQRIAH